MHLTARPLVAALLLLSVSSLRAQTVADPSGHWEGSIQAPFGEVPVAVDLAMNDHRKLMGTFTNPGEHILGLPLANVTVDGRSVSLEIKAGAGGEAFKGALSADGRSLSGDFLVSVYSVPFSLTRTGDARIEPAPRSPAIDKALEGAWSGTLDIDGRELPVVVTITNHADGTATGDWANDGGVRIPITIAYQGSSLTLGTTVSTGSYSGTVSAQGTEIVGVFTEGALNAPLTLRRAATVGTR